MPEIMRADKEYAKLRELPRTECPENLKKRAILTVGQFKCDVFYEYVDKGEYGIVPVNCWRGVLLPNLENLSWFFPLGGDVRTLKEACKIIRPIFKIAVARRKNSS